jgi:hypothetical protein
MSKDYCWKLASHAQLKILELTRYRPSAQAATHPANAVIDRIQSKLSAIASGSDVRAAWVIEARDAVRAGCFHPAWEGHIELLEAIL